MSDTYSPEQLTVLAAVKVPPWATHVDNWQPGALGGYWRFVRYRVPLEPPLQGHVIGFDAVQDDHGRIVDAMLDTDGVTDVDISSAPALTAAARALMRLALTLTIHRDSIDNDGSQL